MDSNQQFCKKTLLTSFKMFMRCHNRVIIVPGFQYDIVSDVNVNFFEFVGLFPQIFCRFRSLVID